MTFETLDYTIFGATLMISAAIGVFYRFTGGKQKTNEEFLFGNKNQNPLWVAFSLMASFMSAVSMLSGSAEAYTYGTHFFLVNLGHTLGIIGSLILFVPVLYELKTVSVYQYLAKRFGNTTRLLASIAFTVQMLLYMSIALVAPSIALQTVTNISHEVSIIISGLACISYATLGGMKAIIITDTFQSVLMFGSMFAVIISGYIRSGSFGKIIHIANEHGRIDFTNFSLDLTIRHTWLSTILGGFFSSLILNGINQIQVQRYLTMKNYKHVVIAALTSAPLISALSICICFSGLTLFAEYVGCDPVKSGEIASADQLLAYYVTNTFRGSGLSGLFVAGIFSASLSTVSPLLNSLAAVTFEDYFKPAMKCSQLKNEQFNSSYYTQIFTLLYGAACLCLSLLALHVTSLLQASIIIFNFVGGPLLGIFTLGMFTSTANQKGTIPGFIIGMISIATLSLIPKPGPVPLSTNISNCTNLPIKIINSTGLIDEHNSENNLSIAEYITRISYLYYGVIGFLITFIIGYVVSVVFKDDKKINANLLHKMISKHLLKKGFASIYQENEEREYL